MRCSDCGTPIRPVVAIDIDGTLANYHGYLVTFAANYLGVTQPNGAMYNGKGSFRAWFCKTFDVDRRTWNDIKLAYRQGGMKRSQPVMPGAAELVAGVRMNAEVWLTTTRPYLRLDGIDPDTRHWLHTHRIKYDYLLYHEDKYQVLAERVDHQRVVAIVDDLAEQYDASVAAFGPNIPILVSTRYNEWNTRPNMARNLIHADEIITERLEKWYAEHPVATS